MATAGAAVAAVATLLLLGDGPGGTRGAGTGPAAGGLEPVAVTAPAAPDAATREACTALGVRLPVTLGDLPARGTVPSDPALAAWGEPAVVLRCGVRAVVGASAGDVVVEGVRWDARPRGATTRFYLLDRAVTVEVAVPAEHEGGPVLRALADAVAAALPER